MRRYRRASEWAQIMAEYKSSGLVLPVPGLLLKAMKNMVERAAETSGRK